MSYSKEQTKEKMTPKMREIIETFESFGAPPLPSVSPQVARELPTMSDAVLGTMAKHFMKKIIGPVEAVGSVEHKVIPGGEGELLLRIYSPKGEGPFPVLVYYHGGGWVIANLDTYDSSCRALTNAAETIVVSVAYRQAPENKYPAPQDDAFSAYKWVLENAATFNGETKKIMIGGESAGGNLATTVCLLARDNQIKMPLHQLLIYPVTSFSFDSESHELFRNALPLDREMMKWFRKHYLESELQMLDPLISPLKADLHGLPAATIITAEIDPLCSEGEAYADKLIAAGINVEQKRFDGVTHEFFGMTALLPEAKEAVSLAASRMNEACDQITNISEHRRDKDGDDIYSEIETQRLF